MKKKKHKERQANQVGKFWASINIPVEDTEEQCWEWIGSTSNGYGKIYTHVTTQAHVFMYYLVHGTIPTGYVVHHTCLNRICVNINHLECLTQGEHRREHALIGNSFSYPGRNCIQCGEYYDPKAGHQKYCNNTCRHNAWLIRRQ